MKKIPLLMLIMTLFIVCVKKKDVDTSALITKPVLKSIVVTEPDTLEIENINTVIKFNGDWFEVHYKVKAGGAYYLHFTK